MLCCVKRVKTSPLYKSILALGVYGQEKHMLAFQRKANESTVCAMSDAQAPKKVRFYVMFNARQ